MLKNPWQLEKKVKKNKLINQQDTAGRDMCALNSLSIRLNEREKNVLNKW